VVTREPPTAGISPPPEAPPTERDWRAILRAVVGESAAVDVAVYDAVASSRAADHSVLWFAIAGVLALTGGRRGRLAARDGVLAIGMASATVNLGVKPLAPRRRPLRDEVALAQHRWVRMPTSTSFPSGHTASAFAFATAVGQRIPALWIPLRGLALLVGYSRIHTGVHYPGDVVAGAVVGTSCGFAVARRTSRDR